jgi:HSP20 family protein
MKIFTGYRPFNFSDTWNRDNLSGANLASDCERVIENIFGNIETGFARGPRVDVRETDTGYVLEAELPGVDESDIDVNIDGGMLHIESKSESASTESDDDKGKILSERNRTGFSRSFKLPENADTESINASFKNGLLTLDIKKRAEAQKRVIPITK